MHAYQCAYSIHCTAYSLSMLIFSWNKIFHSLINALHHHYVIDDVINQNYCFSAVSRNKLCLHKKNIHFRQLLNDKIKILLQYRTIWSTYSPLEVQAYPTLTLSTTPVTEIAKVNFKPNSKLLKIFQKFQKYRNIEPQLKVPLKKEKILPWCVVSWKQYLRTENQDQLS